MTTADPTLTDLACPKCGDNIYESEFRSVDGPLRGFMCVPCDWTVIQGRGSTATPAEFIASVHAAGKL